MQKGFDKEWYKSKTVWSCAAALVIAVASAMVGESNVIVAVLVSVASALGIYGRADAKVQIK